MAALFAKARPLDAAERVLVTKLMEMQRHAMLMYTSCGWFFDEPSGIETVQILTYAARAMQLAAEFGPPLEPEFLRRPVRRARSSSESGESGKSEPTGE